MTTLDDLDFNLASYRNPDVKNCNLSINVYNGRLQATIFNNKRYDGSVALSPWFVQFTKFIWNTRLKTPTPNTNVAIAVSVRNKETKEYEKNDIIIYGYTENNEPYIGLKNDKKQYSHKFLLEAPLDYDTNRTDVTKNELAKVSIDAFLDVLSSEATVAIRLSKVKPNRQNNNNNNNNYNNKRDYTSDEI